MKDLLKNIVVKIIIWEAKFILKKSKPKIIAVTGNLGKTSTKDFISAVLQDNLKDEHGKSLVLSSPKSMNSEFGVPLTILELKTGWNSLLAWLKIVFAGLIKMLDKFSYKYLVLEIGADRPHDIENITKYIKPDIAVITAFAKVPVHIEFFDNQREAVIREKTYLVEALKKGGTFIYNVDDEDCRAIAAKFTERDIHLKTFSLKDKEADVYVSNIKVEYSELHKFATSIAGSEAVVHLGSEEEPIHLLGVVGEAIYYSLLPSILIAKEFAIPVTKALKDIEVVERTPGRMRVLAGIHNTTLIDDTYNASPKATENGIEFIKKAKTKGKKIFILGDMLELGEFTRAEHERIGKEVAKVADILITSGVRARMIAEEAIREGLAHEKVFMTENSREAAQKILEILEKEVEADYQEGRGENELGGDLIYVKGSQGSRMEIVSRAILSKDYNPAEVLVRQENAWQER